MSLKLKVELIELIEKILEEDPSDFSIKVGNKHYKVTIDQSDSWSTSSDTRVTIEISEEEKR